MPAGQYALRLLQLGFEGTAGNIVAATQKLVGSGMMTPEIERENEDFPRGVRATFDSMIDLRRGVLLNHEGNLTFEEILYPLLTGLNDDAVPADAGPYVWTMEPVLTGIATPKSCSAEMVVEDGATDFYEQKAAYLLTRSFEIGLEANRPATLAFEMFGRVEETATKTGSLTPITGRTVVPSNMFKVYIDDDWASLGGTQKSGLVRSATLSVVTGLEPDYSLDGRTSLDHTGFRSGMVTGTLSIVMQHNADAATEFGKWRDGSLRFVRLIADNGGAGGDNKKVQIDLAGRYTSPPDFQEEDGIELLSAELELMYDPTGAKIISTVITNGLATQP